MMKALKRTCSGSYACLSPMAGACTISSKDCQYACRILAAPQQDHPRHKEAELNTYVLFDVPEGRKTGPRIFERADARSARAVFIFSSSGSGAYSGYDRTSLRLSPRLSARVIPHLRKSTRTHSLPYRQCHRYQGHAWQGSRAQRVSRSRCIAAISDERNMLWWMNQWTISAR